MHVVKPSGIGLVLGHRARHFLPIVKACILLGIKSWHGAGSSRDWAAKGTKLQGVKAVIAESFERIHRSNLVGMGVVPCEFINGETAESLGLTGQESFTITGIAENFAPGKILRVVAQASQPAQEAGKDACSTTSFQVKVRVDTPLEIEYLKNGGVLNYVLRNFMQAA